jgi:hypothetical protein
MSQVILMAQVDHTRVGFEDFRLKLLEKSSLEPHLKKAWDLWVLELCLKINLPSAKVIRRC